MFTPQSDLLAQIGRKGCFVLDSLPHMRIEVAADPDPERPTFRRIYMSHATWETLGCDRKAGKLFFATVLDYPLGRHHLFGEDYRRAVRRYHGQLPRQGWVAAIEREARKPR